MCVCIFVCVSCVYVYLCVCVRCVCVGGDDSSRNLPGHTQGMVSDKHQLQLELNAMREQLQGHMAVQQERDGELFRCCLRCSGVVCGVQVLSVVFRCCLWCSGNNYQFCFCVSI